MRATRYLIPLAVVAALVAGCSSKKDGAAATPTTAPADNGIAALSATEIAAKAATALQNAPSVHIKGSITSEGETTTIDIKMSKHDGVGTISISGSTIEITKVSGDVYLKADANFWKNFAGDKGDLVATLLQGKYLKASTSDENLGALASFFDTSELLKATGTLSKGETKVVNGLNAIAVIDNDATGGGTLWVATQGEPYPLRMEATSGGGALDFTDYGTAVEVKTPPADQVIDLAQLAQLGG
jgi:hypothetical protein